MNVNNNEQNVMLPQGIGVNVFEDIRILIAQFPNQEWDSDLVSFVVNNAVVATVLRDITCYPRQQDHRIAVFRGLMAFVDIVIFPCRDDVQDPHDLMLFSENNLPTMLARMIDIASHEYFDEDDYFPFDLDFYILSFFSSENLKHCLDQEEAILKTAAAFHGAVYTAMNEYARQ